nr:hypothetical protein [Tanacetum cinerariifolium]
MWEAIKSRFGGNDESKKMQKYLLKQQFEGFSVSASEGLHKGYDRFQTLLSQLDIHGAGVALIMRTKPGLDTLSFDDIYNNLRVFERDVEGTTPSSYLLKQQFEGFSVSASEGLHKGYDRALARDCKAIGNQDSRRRDVRYNGNQAIDNGRRSTYQDDSKDLVTIDGEDIDWSGHVEEDAQNYAMMAYSFNNSDYDNEVKSCSKTCKESSAGLKKFYDEQRDKLGDASVEITAYTLALKKVEAQLLCHQQNQLAYEQKI